MNRNLKWYVPLVDLLFSLPPFVQLIRNVNIPHTETCKYCTVNCRDMGGPIQIYIYSLLINLFFI
jgi:Cdc6-like AAA superfamily ATPase